MADVVSVNTKINWPRGFTITDNRIEDELQRFLSPSAYCVWRQYLRYWGGTKKRAYPSLSTLSKVTGLSERTIRKCNKELVKKKFLKKKSGNSNSSNTYFYVKIESILKYYTNRIEVVEEQEETLPPIHEEQPNFEKVDELFSHLETKQQVALRGLLLLFRKLYKEKLGFDYVESVKDVESLIENAEPMLLNLDRYETLFNLFFSTKNKYIEESDRSLYFLFRPKIMKTLISEYANTDAGRWEAQAEKHWKAIQDILRWDATHLNGRDETEEFVRLNIKLSGANKKRDQFIIDYLVNKVERYLGTH